MTEELDQLGVENLDEELDSTPEQESDESFDDFQERISKAEEIANNQKIRAEKAEAALKKLQKPEPVKEETETPKNDTNMSLKDILAAKDLHEEDVDYLLEKSKEYGKTISELKKDKYMQVVLKSRAEERATAEATSTAPTKRGTRRDSDEVILENAKQGKVSDKDEDIQKLVEAEFNLKRTVAKGN